MNTDERSKALTGLDEHSPESLAKLIDEQISQLSSVLRAAEIMGADYKTIVAIENAIELLERAVS